MRFFVAILATAFVLGACAGASAPGATTDVTATLDDRSISLSTVTFPAGTVHLNVVNGGSLVHELVLLKTNLAHDKIPTDPADPARVEERGSVGESGDVPPGQTKQLTLDLAPGRYVLVCNEPGHYIVGMHTALVVK